MRKNPGFTLIELIVVLVVMAIIAGITVPRYTGAFDSINFRRTMSDLTLFLREARIRAMSRGEVTNIVFNLHGGFCFNEDKRIFKIPRKIEIFTDKFEARDDQTKKLVFYPNGTASDEKLGFACDKMVAVLHVEPLGGLAYYKINEEMEQAVRYARKEETSYAEEMEKDIDKLKDSDTVTKGTTADKKEDVNSASDEEDKNGDDSDEDDESSDEDAEEE